MADTDHQIPAEQIRAAFQEDERKVRVQNYRVGCILGIVFMPAGVALDYIVYGGFSDENTGLVLPFFGLRVLCSLLLFLVWYLLGTRLGSLYYRTLGLIEVSLPIFFISWMIAVTEGASSTYYAGINLVLMGAGIVLRWGLADSLWLLLISFVMYFGACLVAHPGLDKPFYPTDFYNNCYFLLVTGVFIATGNYFYNKLRFSEFESRYQLNHSRLLLQESNHKLRELDEIKSRFFANISHELRTPLTLLLAPLESMRQEPAIQQESRLQEWTETMFANGMRLLKLINDLLELVRLDSGKLELKREPIALEEFFRGLTNSVQKLAEDKGVRVTAHIDPEAGDLFADRDKLEKVFLNLIFNAIKFTPAGGWIEIRSRRIGDSLQLAVRDTGVGIDKKMLTEIFGRFWQADTSAKRKYQGAGIGLALVKELVEAHGGTVTVESDPGQGATFFINLPDVRPEPGPAPASDTSDSQTPEPKPVEQTEEWLSGLYRRAELFPSMTSLRESFKQMDHLPPGKRKKVLIADDEPDMLRFLKSQLTGEFQVLEATDGQQAIDLAAQYLPDAIVCDMMMPEKDGQVVCVELKQRETTRHIPILMLTARADEQTKIQVLKAGAEDFLTKPFSSTELRVRLANLIKSHFLQAELARQNRRLEQAMEQLKETESQLVQNEKMASLGRMSAGIIHEINNPLNFSNTALYSIKSVRRFLPEDQLEDFDEMIQDTQEGISRVASIISDLRTFTHPNSDDQSPVDVSDLVSGSLRFVSDQLSDKVDLRMEIEEALSLRCNQNLISQVIVNLVQNALDAFAERDDTGASPVITVQAGQTDDEIHISVRDNGPGIPEDRLSHIFEPFYTTKKVGKGMGLGLSICYQIMERHGGKISVRSEPGQFSEFTLEFPQKIPTMAI